ncbi:TonB-dependent hemoglobin/transferrin/lactoferrin family receptor [Uliginosibacterium sediminicola]|uniref:TonB-dependent hemoglobin/transferrin/lactoferrin family receptor n=1 Tax=Uliginosibacterium sediminicola TaxID=2024550 RepID=A0ABU9Z355_9RHOO
MCAEASAQQAAAALKPEAEREPAARLDEVTVTSTRTERRVDNVPNTVTVTSAARIQERGARDIKDVFRDELDVSVRAQSTRFTAAGASTGRAGNDSINVRGLEGNQVLMLLDGVRVPNSFSFGAFASGRGDYFATDTLKSVEVLRGPASTQYGSDGLAGAVSLRTLDPADVLRKGSDVGGFVRSSYASVDDSWSHTLAAAGRSGMWEGLFLTNQRNGHETKTHGSDESANITRTAANPLDYDSQSYLGKAYLTLNALHRFGLTIERHQRDQTTEVYSARAVPPLAASSTLDLDADDTLTRDRVSLEHRYTNLNADWIQRAESRVYWQDAKAKQYAFEDRNTSADRVRDGHYKQGTVGAAVLLESNLTAGAPQRLSYGVDWSRSEISGLRDGTVPPFGETFPSKPFPDTTYTQTGAFAQDEVELGKLSVIPGLRYDHYKLDPSGSGYSGNTYALSDKAITPRLGLVWRALPALAPYLQLARGFRAPTPDQVNNGFSNPASGYTTIGNPDLRAERANSVELGLRGKLAAWRYSLAAYDNRYRDFISQRAVSGSGTTADPTVFQYINLARAHIWGAELRGEWQAATRLLVNGGIAWSRGNSESNGATLPLDTIQPIRLVLGSRYELGDWTARANLTHARRKKQSDTDSSTTLQFAPPSWTVLDVGASWKASDRWSLNLNVNNVFDAHYWFWSDVRGLADNSSVKDAYSAPGRNVQLSARYDF